MKTLQLVTLLAAILASGLMAGLFVGFAYSVMPGLGRSSDRTMIEAMQNINQAIVNGWFLLLFLGPIPLLILAAVLAWRGQGRPALPWILAALALYLIAFLITSGVNVPLNDQLAEVGNPRHIHDLEAIRSGFESKWVTWNIARGVLHTVAFGCLAWALVIYGTHRTLSAADQDVRAWPVRTHRAERVGSCRPDRSPVSWGRRGTCNPRQAGGS
jgi:uncharacterized membrane protein